MKFKKLAAAVMSASLMSSAALADTSSLGTGSTVHGILENDYVRAGVNSVAGTFGSGGNTRPGLQYDSTGTGTFPADSEQGDYLTPGSPFDGFSVMIDGTNTSNNNARAVQWEASPGGLVDGENTLTWYGAGADGWGITNIYTLGATSQYIDITTNLEAGTAADDVYFSRHIDPDAMPDPADTSATDNVLGYGVIPDSNVAFSEATTSRYALGLYSTDSNVDAGISNTWTQSADGYTDSPYTDADGNSVNYGNGDHTIGLTWHWEDVSAGDIMTANYAYIFGPSAFDAADTAIDEGAGGGADTSGWGELEDVGSATEAAESAGSGPTVIGEATSTITRHTATETATTQTVAREMTTSTWDVYDDGSTGTAVDTVEDLTPFTGRIDQSATVQDVVGSTLRTLDFNNIQGVRMNSTYNNGMSGNTNGVVVGGTKELENGFSISGGFSRLGTSMSGNGDSVSAETTAFAGGIEKNNIKLELRRATTDYTVERTVGDYVLFDHFTNTSESKGTDTSVRVTYSPDTGKVNPVIGYTRGKRTMDGYTETGSIQSARTVGATDDMYGYGTVGLRGDLGLVDFTAMHHTDGVNDVSLGIEKDTGTITWRVEGTRSMTNLGDTNAVSAGLVIKF